MPWILYGLVCSIWECKSCAYTLQQLVAMDFRFFSSWDPGGGGGGGLMF